MGESMKNCFSGLRTNPNAAVYLLALTLAGTMSFMFASCENGLADPIYVTVPAAATNAAETSGTASGGEAPSTGETPAATGGGGTQTASPNASIYGSKSADAEKAVGDIIFTDGSAVPYSDDLELTEEQKAAAIAVVFYAGLENGRFGVKNLGVGLVEAKKAWSVIDSQGSRQSSSVSDENDGKKNADAIMTFDDYKNGGEKNYPAFYWAEHYSLAEKKLTGSAFENNWYLPSEKEFEECWKQINIVNKAIAKIDAAAALQTSGLDSLYWLSSAVRWMNLSNCESREATLPLRTFNARPVRMFGGNVPLEASDTSYTITFDSDGGTKVSPIYRKAGQKALKPSDPTNGSRAFMGWYLGEDEFDFENTEITQNLPLKAKWWWGLKKPSEPKAVLDIVFKDGSASAYSRDLALADEQKNAAIAVIFYVGADCSNDGRTRTLGIGLKFADSLAWCASDANAYNKSISSISCNAENYEGRYELILGSMSMWYTRILSPSDADGSDNLSQIAEALGGDDDTSSAEKYPAFYFAKNYKEQEGSRVKGTAYEDGWYLPSAAECQKICDNEQINWASALCKGNWFYSFTDGSLFIIGPKGEGLAENPPYWSSSVNFYRGQKEPFTIEPGRSYWNKGTESEASAWNRLLTWDATELKRAWAIREF